MLANVGTVLPPPRVPVATDKNEVVKALDVYHSLYDYEDDVRTVGLGFGVKLI